MKHPDFGIRFKQAAANTIGPVYTQKDLSSVLGVSEVMIWSYKNGEKLPKLKTAMRIAERFNVSVEWLLQGTGSPIRDESAKYHTGEPLPESTQLIMDFVAQLSRSDRRKALALLQDTLTKAPK